MSFTVTAALTFIAIVVGYFSDSLPDATLTQLDRASIVQLSRMRWTPWSQGNVVSKWTQHSTRVLSAWAGNDGSAGEGSLQAEEKRRRGRMRRSKGLERFVLALSDQQLVTGLAILIAAYTNRCTLTLYNFNIVATLAWFSSTTHLSTLAVLRVYFMDRPRVRDWRVAAMLSLLGLLSAAQFVQYLTKDSRKPIQCALNRLWDLYYLDLMTQSLIQLALVEIFLFVTYCDRIGRLYSHDPDWAIQGWIIEFAIHKFATRKAMPSLEGILIATSKRSKAEQGAAIKRLRQRRRYCRYVLRQKLKGNHLARWFAQVAFISEEISHAFLSDLLTLLFGVVFGVSRIIVVRKRPVSGDHNTMNFGQIVPLLLMALPILAAGEALFGMYARTIKDHRI